MTIDPSSPLGSTIRSLQTQQQESVKSLARALDIKIGDTVTGTVTNISNVTPQTRQTLLSAYFEQQARLSQQHPGAQQYAQTQSNQSQSIAPDSQLALLQSAKLKLLQVEVRQQQLLTYTDQSLQKNQPVQLQLKAANQLVLLNALGGSPQNRTLQNQGATPQPSGALTPQQTQVLQQALRNSLPQQLQGTSGGFATNINTNINTNASDNKVINSNTALSSSLQIAQLLGQLTQKMGSYSSQSYLPKDLQEALKSVAQHLRSPEQLAKPDNLKQSVQNAGQQLESRLANLAQRNAPPVPPGPTRGAPPNQSPAHLASPVGGRTATPHTGQVSANNSQLPQQDLKAALLGLLNQINQTRAASTDPQRESQTSNPSRQLNNPNTLLLILKSLLQGAPELSQVKQQIPREALIQQLQQMVQQALNKIQYQQLQSLAQKHGQSQDPHAPTSSHWQLDIPVRYGHDVHNLSLQINEDWVQQRKEEETGEEERQKVRKWFVKLCFELPDAGMFHAHINIVNDAVNASLWAEDPATLQKTQAQLGELKSRLKKDGVEVKSLDCFPGKPPQQENRLSYSLVDIKT